MKNTGAGASAVNSVYSLYLKYSLSYQSTLREKMLLFWSLHLITAFFQKISSNVFRDILEILNDIFISSCRNDPSQLRNCRRKRFFTVFRTLLVTWRQRKEILSPSPPPQQRIFCLFFLQVWTFHPLWYVRHCAASTVVPKYGPHLVHVCSWSISRNVSPQIDGWFCWI